MKWSVCAFGLLLGSAALVAEPRELLNVAYAPHEDSELRTLSAFVPEEPVRAPVLVFFHGGGWRTGDKEALYAFGRRLAGEGVVAVLPNYRLAPAHKYPKHAQDAAAATAWTAERLVGWRADPRCLFVGGHSAGAHLAAVLATDSQAWGDGKGPELAGVISVSGVFRIAPQEGGATREFLASVFGEDEAVWRTASPIDRLTSLGAGSHLPPFALIWSSGEDPLAVRESVEFARMLRETGREVSTAEVASDNHEAGLGRVTGRLLSELTGGRCRGVGTESDARRPG
jgi:acetyl esterase/lipase